MAKKGLGKGLGVLLTATETVASPQNTSDDAVVELKIIDVEPNAEQPRKKFDDEHLAFLAESIKEHGVISPILVCKSDNGYYKIIAGERRWRASKLAGKKTIPAIVKDYDQMKVYEVSLIENLQRQDLNPVEEALGYKKLIDDFDLTQDQIAKKLSKSRSSIANSLRLLSLSEEVLGLLENGSISTGHAKILAGIDNAKILICTGCGHTHSVLPDPVIPYCRHSLRFILRVLAVHAFHLQSVEKICDVFQISVKTFYRWQKVFYEHQDKWQDFLSAAKRDLKAALLELCRKTPFCTFAECFIRKSGHSFLQSHKNPVFPNQKKKLVPNPP